MFKKAAYNLKEIIEKFTLGLMFLIGGAIIVFSYILAQEADSIVPFAIGLVVTCIVLFFIWFSALLIIALCDMMCDVKEIKNLLKNRDFITDRSGAENENQRNAEGTSDASGNVSAGAVTMFQVAGSAGISEQFSGYQCDENGFVVSEEIPNLTKAQKKEQYVRLMEFLDNGAITQEEFEKRKKELGY